MFEHTVANTEINRLVLERPLLVFPDEEELINERVLRGCRVDIDANDFSRFAAEDDKFVMARYGIVRDHAAPASDIENYVLRVEQSTDALSEGNRSVHVRKTAEAALRIEEGLVVHEGSRISPPARALP